MSIDHGVLPFDPDDQDFCSWLQSEGIDFPEMKGRFPTLDELTNVLHTFAGLTVNVDQGTTTVVSLGKPEEPGFALMLGEVTTAGYYDFFFWGWRNEKLTMVEILKRLSVVCGPLVLREQYSSTPVLITPDIDLVLALQEWHERFLKKNT